MRDHDSHAHQQSIFFRLCANSHPRKREHADENNQPHTPSFLCHSKFNYSIAGFSYVAAINGSAERARWEEVGKSTYGQNFTFTCSNSTNGQPVVWVNCPHDRQIVYPRMYQTPSSGLRSLAGQDITTVDPQRRALILGVLADPLSGVLHSSPPLRLPPGVWLPSKGSYTISMLMSVNSPRPGSGTLAAVFDIASFLDTALTYRNTTDFPGTYPLNVALWDKATGDVLVQRKAFDQKSTAVCMLCGDGCPTSALRTRRSYVRCGAGRVYWQCREKETKGGRGGGGGGVI